MQFMKWPRPTIGSGQGPRPRNVACMISPFLRVNVVSLQSPSNYGLHVRDGPGFPHTPQTMSTGRRWTAAPSRMWIAKAVRRSSSYMVCAETCPCGVTQRPCSTTYTASWTSMGEGTGCQTKRTRRPRCLSPRTVSETVSTSEGLRRSHPSGCRGAGGWSSRMRRRGQRLCRLGSSPIFSEEAEAVNQAATAESIVPATGRLVEEVGHPNTGATVNLSRSAFARP